MVEIDNDPFITRPVARRIYLGGISDDTAAAWQAAGKLPPLIRLSPKVVGWRKSTLEAHLAARNQASKAATADHPALALVRALFSKDRVLQWNDATRATLQREVLDYIDTRARLEGLLPEDGTEEKPA